MSVLTTTAFGSGEEPIQIRSPRSGADLVFRAVLAVAGAVVVVLLGATILFLVIRAWPAFHKTGLQFITSDSWQPPIRFGALGALVGSAAIGVLALAIALPVSIACALLINEYAPRTVRNALISVVDLLATVPSIVYGFWGLRAFGPAVNGATVWLAHHANFIPIFRSFEPDTYGSSIFLCGIIVAVMIVPFITSISREVLAQAPREPCEAALALGGTRWGMVTDVLLPFARNGIVGAAMIGLGRALGETMAVLLILSSRNIVTSAILGPNGLGAVAQLIASNFSNSGDITKSALTLAGLALFTVTLLVNLVARIIVSRSVARAT